MPERTAGRWILVGSNFGRTGHPAWTANLLAHPDAEVSWKGADIPVTARLLAGEERAAAWEALLAFWPPYATYQARVEREIRLSPPAHAPRVPDPAPAVGQPPSGPGTPRDRAGGSRTPAGSARTPRCPASPPPRCGSPRGPPPGGRPAAGARTPTVRYTAGAARHVQQAEDGRLLAATGQRRPGLRGEELRQDREVEQQALGVQAADRRPRAGTRAVRVRPRARSPAPAFPAAAARPTQPHQIGRARRRQPGQQPRASPRPGPPGPPRPAPCAARSRSPARPPPRPPSGRAARRRSHTPSRRPARSQQQVDGEERDERSRRP